MTFGKFESAIAQIPIDLIVLGEESGCYTADIEWGNEWYCVTYALGNWTLSRDQSTQAIAINSGDLPNLEAKIQELKGENR